MSGDDHQGYTVAEAAKALSLSERQVRRLIHSGSVDADLIQGKYGPEYRITTLPTVRPGPGPKKTEPQPELRALQLSILKLSTDLEVALARLTRLEALEERLTGVEGRVRLLAPPRRRRVPWWKRLLWGD